MNHNNDWYNEQNRANYSEKLRPDTFFKRNKWIIIILSTLVVLVVIFASTTFYLLTRPQNRATTTSSIAPTAQTGANPTSSIATATPQATAAPVLGATVTSPPQSPTPLLTPSTKNYQFICLTNCDDKFDVVLNDITVNTTNQTMAWDFTITDNGNICTNMYDRQLALQSPSGETINADGGTLTAGIAINADQALPRTATFSMLPHQGIQYTTNLQMRCDDPFAEPTYQAVLFSY